jgi:hypothetical protein
MPATTWTCWPPCAAQTAWWSTSPAPAVTRRLLARLAARAGRQPHLLLIDVRRHDALAGQRQRRRRMRPPAFERHWARWEALRRSRGELPREGWAGVLLLDRETAGRLRRIEIPPARR